MGLRQLRRDARLGSAALHLEDRVIAMRERHLRHEAERSAAADGILQPRLGAGPVPLEQSDEPEDARQQARPAGGDEDAPLECERERMGDGRGELGVVDQHRELDERATDPEAVRVDRVLRRQSDAAEAGAERRARHLGAVRMGLHDGLQREGHALHKRPRIVEHDARPNQHRQRVIGLVKRPAQRACTGERAQRDRARPGVARSMAHLDRQSGVRVRIVEAAAGEAQAGENALRQRVIPPIVGPPRQVDGRPCRRVDFLQTSE
jgi:hypothetical protein